MIIKIKTTSCENTRNHLRRVLEEAVSVEEDSLSLNLDDDARIAKGKEKMKPLIQELNTLKNEVREIKGLEIKPVEIGPEMGHVVNVQANSSLASDLYSISTNHDNSKFTIEEFCSVSTNGSFRADNFEYEKVDDVIAKVTRLVIQHFVAARAKLESGYA